MSTDQGGGNPYRDWPYATEYLLETLDPELIESHAELILSRALNIGRTVGFIGAGVSMAYGRISWQTLVDTELKRVRAKLKTAQDDFPAEWRGAPGANARRLVATLDALDLPRSDVKPDRYPMLFQVSEQLDQALSRFLMIHSPDQYTDRDIMREHAARLTRDDEGHAYQILIDALQSLAQPPVAEKRARDFINWIISNAVSGNGDVTSVDMNNVLLGNKPITKAPTPVDKTAYRQYFNAKYVQLLLDMVPRSAPGLDSIHSAVRQACNRSGAPYSGVGSKFLLPTDRYLVGILIRLASLSETTGNLAAFGFWNAIAASTTKTSGKHVAETTRHSLVSQWRDPLLIMQERLQISRFLTTNYDHEIQRMFGDQRFRSKQSNSPSASLLRPTFEDIVFNNSRAGELIAFAVKERSRSGSVIHLHGHADAPSDRPSERIVVTERDYQERYLRRDSNRTLVDDAIRLTFGSSPMLFVGSNMGEDDLLRPLRQFVSGPARITDRVAIAIIPAMNNRAKRTEEKIALLGRHGVYAIHFGNCRSFLRNTDGKASTTLGMDTEWLPWIWSIRNVLSDAMRDFLNASDSELQGRIAGTAAVLHKLMEAGPDLTPQASRDLHRSSSEPAELASAIKIQKNAFRSISASRFTLHPPSELEGRTSDDRRPLELRSEIDVFNATITWLCHLASKCEPDALPDKAPLRIQLQAMLAALEGASDAILSTLTCARLLKIQRDWDNWKDNWFILPKPATLRPIEPAGAQLTAQGPVSLVAAGALVDHRHLVLSPSKPASNPRYGRFYRGAPSQSFYGLLEALAGENATQFRETTGRRAIFVAAERGLGRGHFFGSLSDCWGTSDPNEQSTAPTIDQPRVLAFLRALNGNSQHPFKWRGLSFLNLSFSQEVMSAFDRISELLFHCFKSIEEGRADKSGYQTLKDDRLGRLRAIMEAWASYGDQNPTASDRVLIALNGFSILFDADGKPKNGEIRRICDILFSSEFSAAPIDFVLSCQSDRLPRYLFGEHDLVNIDVLERSANDKKSLLRDERMLRTIRGHDSQANQTYGREHQIIWSTANPSQRFGNWQILKLAVVKEPPPREGSVRKTAVALHLLQAARASVFSAAFFPRVAILLARSVLWETIKANSSVPLPKQTHYPNVFEPTSSTFREAMRDALNRLQSRTPIIQPKYFVPIATVTLAMLLDFGAISSADQLADELTTLVSYTIEQIGAYQQNNQTVTILECCQRHLSTKISDKPVANALISILEECVAQYNTKMRSIFEAVGGGRLLMTLMFTAAYEATAELTHFGSDDDRKPILIRDVDDLTNQLVRVLDRIRIALMGVPDAARSNIVIEETLATIRRRSERGDTLPFVLCWSAGETSTSLYRASDPSSDGTPAVIKPLLHKLMTEIIWYLAIIGQPTEKDVLERCENILKVANEIRRSWPRNSSAPSPPPSVSVCVREALMLAINRNFVFRIRAHHLGKPSTNEVDGDVRYAVHRLIQRYVFQSLGAPDVEFTDADQFTLSLYASQPDDQPRLSIEAHDQVGRVIADLCGYPQSNQTEVFAREKDPGLKQNLLRAALGTTRSIYSVSVLGRLDRSPSDHSLSPLDEGYFEEHRRKIRWLIKASVDLTTQHPSAAPFYAEEIVWLYNECAVLSLVQGRLADAHALFGRAIEAASKIEPDTGGPLHIRIQLNKALCDIERGHGPQARGQLKRISAITDDHPVPPLLARGYLGLIDHLAGEVREAEGNYEFAIEGLVKLRRSRAASIFSRHYGDLLRTLRQPQTDQARRLIEDAVHFAQEGGHEDAKYLALLSLARLKIQLPDVGQLGASIHRELDAIEAYGRTVGMPRLLCEVSLTRAHLLLEQGETERAGTLAMQSLEIASMNDLRLRKVAGLLLMAEIFLRRNQPATARPLLAQGSKLAKSSNSHFALTHVQSLNRQLSFETGGE